jgi:hypothetical protein
VWPQALAAAKPGLVPNCGAHLATNSHFAASRLSQALYVQADLELNGANRDRTGDLLLAKQA